ncbi:MAG TPA: hypothetical protein PLM07_02625 [Candidatus Rifleibacterium sp.]|nr:hypothetical protein [Candidatus Rifleibacterium sp.]HPT44778.1 hypothetical protein [Candidatus Rifleibacterium sp.]
MRKFILDFEFNETTGATRIIVDFSDPSMSNVEINEAIRNGELLEEVLKEAGQVFGDNVANRVRNGEIAAVCLDHHPELRKDGGAVQINQPVAVKREIKQ